MCIRDRHWHAPALGEAEGGQRVAGLARLADDDDEVVGVEDGVTIAELAGAVHLGRDPDQPLDGSLAHHTGVHGRAAGHKVDVLDAAQLLIAQLRDCLLYTSSLCPGPLRLWRASRPALTPPP